MVEQLTSDAGVPVPVTFFHIFCVSSVFIPPILTTFGGMNLYKEIQMKIYAWTGNQTRDPCIISPGLHIILKLQRTSGLITYQVLLAHIDIFGPTFSMKC